MAEYLKLPEVAHRLNVSEKTARRYVKSGTLPSSFIGGAYRVSEADLKRFLESARVKPGKAEASPSQELSFNDILERERRGAEIRSAIERAVSFRAYREAVDGYCERWETILGEGATNHQVVKEFFDASDGFLHGLQIALDAEIYILGQETGLAASDHAVWSRSEIRRAAERYMEVFQKLLDASGVSEEGTLTGEPLRKKFYEWNQRLSA